MVCQCLLDDLLAPSGAIPSPATPLTAQVNDITTDSRAVKPGNLFVALKGEHFDGHAFVAQSIEKGAIAAVVSQVTPEMESLPVLQVADTLVAYQAIAHWWRQQFSIPIIAVTGSVGKTTTKELIAAVLSQHGTVLKTQANYNNEIGVPKTLLQLNAHHDFAVIEMAMRGPGEIALLTQIAEPTIAVITNVGTAHIGRLGSEAAIAQAKCELLAELSNQGVAILNHENPLLLKTAATVWTGKTITFGLDAGDLCGQLNETHLTVRDRTLPLPLPGRHNALNYLAAIAVAQTLGLDWSSLAQGIQVELPSGRARRYHLSNNILILDETYNAGLESMLAALHLLADTPGQRHIAVLGTMKELGDRSVEFHHQVGQCVQSLKLDELLVLADEAEQKALLEGAASIPSQAFTDHEAIAQYLHRTLKAGDRVLFKASRSVGLDRVVDQLQDYRSNT